MTEDEPMDPRAVLFQLSCGRVIKTMEGVCYRMCEDGSIEIRFRGIWEPAIFQFPDWICKSRWSLDP